MIVLYGPRAAPFVEPVVRALALKRLAFELREPQGAEDARPSSPVPVAEVEGERLQGLAPILLCLERHFPHPPLLSSEPRASAAQLQLATWVNETFAWYLARSQRVLPHAESGTRRASLPGPRESSPPEPPRPRGVSLRDWLGRRLRSPEGGAPELARLAYEIGHRVDDIARLLGDRDFFFADRPGMADLIVHGALKAVSADRIPGTAGHLARHPRLARFMSRVERATGGTDA